MTADESFERHFTFVLIPEFSMLSFSTALEPLRMANRMLGRKVYHWRLVTPDGEPAKASAGLTLSSPG